jgi:hypothetical protein
MVKTIMKKIILLFFIIFYLLINVFAETIKIKGELIDFDERFPWYYQSETTCYAVSVCMAKFKIIEPEKYFNKTIGIISLPLQNNIMKESNIGKFYTFEISESFLKYSPDDDFKIIEGTYIRNLKLEP